MKYYFCLPVAKEYPKNKNESRLANLSNPSREKFLRSPRFLSLSLSLSLSLRILAKEAAKEPRKIQLLRLIAMGSWWRGRRRGYASFDRWILQRPLRRNRSPSLSLLIFHRLFLFFPIPLHIYREALRLHFNYHRFRPSISEYFLMGKGEARHV